MTDRKESVSQGFDRLQDLLLAMHAGDEVWSADAARASGLAEHLCQTVLESLTRAGLMTRESDGRFVRRSLDFRS
jgi:hypothetical protein